MSNMLDWTKNREMWIRVLEKQSGERLETWLDRLTAVAFADQQEMRRWLGERGVSGYAATLLVMERFGYPDFVTASAAELIDAQYADRGDLRPICDAVIDAVTQFGDFTIQARKSYVSLLTSRRTFARIKPSTKKRVDVGLRLDGQQPGGRLLPCKLQATMHVQLSLTSVDELDAEALGWLRQAYAENS